jgi:PTH1 family peptidyl-tRNA hydrolase
VSSIQLIVGLGNPGREYEDTRHNAGAWFVAQLARQQRCTLQSENKFHGLTGRIACSGQDIKLLIPTTFMNLSGQSVLACATFFKIPLDAILVAHDELDIPVGQAKLKLGGGPGGHNGLRDIINKFGNQNNFHRLRIGIGHPGSADKVTGYVLNKPSPDERIAIERTIDAALDVLPLAASGQWARAMNQLHAFKVDN